MTTFFQRGRHSPHPQHALPRVSQHADYGWRHTVNRPLVERVLAIKEQRDLDAGLTVVLASPIRRVA